MTSDRQRPFLVISGLPGSGKTELARQLAPALGLPVIDKDCILEDLFESKGVGNREWRRMLSRESDQILRERATASEGAILVSFWHQPGMASDSGTSVDWLRDLSELIINVHCVCPPEIAAERFLQRKRHPGHLDNERSREETLRRIQAVAGLAPLEIGERVDGDTSGMVVVDRVVSEVQTLLQRAAAGAISSGTPGRV